MRHRALRPMRRLAGQEAVLPTLPLTASWLLLPDQGGSTIGQVLSKMETGTAKKQVLQSIAGAFPGNVLFHKWGMVASAACTLCGAPAETQSHIQCLYPALENARIRTHHNLAHRLWKGISDASKNFHSQRFTVFAASRNLRDRFRNGSWHWMSWRT